MRLRACVASAVGVAAVMAQSHIPWSANERLTWARYLAKPQVASAASAMTAYLTSYNDGCQDGAYWRDVYVAFLPEKSWVKSEVLFRGGSLMLQHEQAHFDLAEVNARRLRQALDRLDKPCEMTEEARGGVVVGYLQRDRDIQARYDAETGFGANASAQAEWLRRVARELDQLRGFAAARR